jgi:hypothetical protein
LRELLALLPASEHIMLDFRGGRRPAHDPDQPIPLDRRVPRLLLSVVTGDGPTRFDSRATVDLAREGPPDKRVIPIQAVGTTHLLLGLEDPPSGIGFWKHSRSARRTAVSRVAGSAASRQQQRRRTFMPFPSTPRRTGISLWKSAMKTTARRPRWHA